MDPVKLAHPVSMEIGDARLLPDDPVRVLSHLDPSMPMLAARWEQEACSPFALTQPVRTSHGSPILARNSRKRGWSRRSPNHGSEVNAGRPGERSSYPFSSQASARYFALRSRPKRRLVMLVSATAREFCNSPKAQSATPQHGPLRRRQLTAANSSRRRAGLNERGGTWPPPSITIC